MYKKDLAKKLNVDPRTLKGWEESKPELIKLINIGLATETNIENTKNYFNNLKEIFQLSSIDLDLEPAKVKKTVLAKRIDVDTKTLSNWEKSKPDLTRIIHLGLSSERHFKEIENYLMEV